MNEPTRLRDGDGAARRLMAGAVMHVPDASRRRALAFTGAATTLGVSATAAASGATSVLKTFVLWVALGATGGGVMSLVASETVARLEAKSEQRPEPRPASAAATVARAAPASSPGVPGAVALDAAPETAASGSAQPLAKDAVARGKASAREAAVTARGDTSPLAAAPLGTSLFEEQRVIESARAALARGDARAAFSLLDGYERAYPSKQFGPEALALRIEALRGNGQLTAARALAVEFAQKYPHHPLLQQVQNTVAK